MDTVDIYKQLEKLSIIDLLLATTMQKEQTKKNEYLTDINKDINKIFRILDNYNDMIGKLEYKVFMLEQQLKENNNK